jgi:hypothetical protein
MKMRERSESVGQELMGRFSADMFEKSSSAGHLELAGLTHKSLYTSLDDLALSSFLDYLAPEQALIIV